MQERRSAAPPQTAQAGNGPLRAPQQVPLTDKLIGSTLVVPAANSPDGKCRYVIEGLLNKGGMGTVYMAQDERGVRVAIKFTPSLQTGMDASDTIAKRFRQEADALTRINHDNVIKIYNCGRVWDQLYIVMEYFDGTPLSKRLDRGYVPWPEAKNILLQACDGLAEVHKNGIIHRDIKPDNIMLKELGLSKLRIKLIDFGAVKFEGAKTITLSGTVIGTIFYASPEQIDGDKDLDNRSDIYSLGTVMYELVAGTRPFNSSTIHILIKQIVKDTPVLPSLLRPGTSKSLDRIILKALEKNPNKRYQSTEEFADAIRNCKWGGKLPPTSRRRPQTTVAEAETDTLPVVSEPGHSDETTTSFHPAEIICPDAEEVQPKKPGRTRIAVIAGAAALLIGAGVLGISHFHGIRPALPTRPPLSEPLYPAASSTRTQPPLRDAGPDSAFSENKQQMPAPAHKVAQSHHPKHPKVVKKATKTAAIQPAAPVSKKDTATVQPKAPATPKDTTVKAHKGPKPLAELFRKWFHHPKDTLAKKPEK